MGKRFKHKALWVVYKTLIVFKRILWTTGLFFFSAIAKVTSKIGVPTIFFFYKKYLWLKHKLRLEKIPFEERTFELIAHPRFLLALSFVFILILLVPHTRLHTKAQVFSPGQESVLLNLIGPGEEFFVEEAIEDGSEEIIDEWGLGAAKSGAIELEAVRPPEVEDLGSLALGGAAITKPTILPGAFEQVRTEIVDYVVQDGDTIGGIAQAFGVSLNTLLWENGLNYSSYIQPGQKLSILPISGVKHKVKKGENLSKLAKTYKVEISEIIKTNRLVDETKIAIGETLLIPGGTKGGFVEPSRRAVISPFRQVTPPPPSVTAPAGSRYIWPTKVKRITQYFGWRHTGIDLANNSGTPIYAARSGKVIYSQCGYNGGYGCNVRIDHGGGVVTLYAHNLLNSHYVKVGDYVQQGQAIAKMGSTGRSTGSHLHFEVIINGQKVNPLKYVK